MAYSNKKMQSELGKIINISSIYGTAGEDLTVTNPTRLKRAVHHEESTRCFLIQN